MKCKTMKHGSIGLQCMMLAFLFAVCFSSCKDSKDETSAPYDPNQPVEVTDFTPKSGGGKKKMIIYGSNFGIDRSIISVKVGGKEAIVVSAKGNTIYCSTPESCFEGTIEVKVGEQTVIASEKYKYDPQTVVTDLCGDVDELGQGDIVDVGPFDDCGKIDYPFWFSFDPQHINRATTITWTNDGDMILAAPQNGGPENRNNIILKRGSSADRQDFKESSWVALARGNACNGSMVLPQTGELYFNHRATGNVYRYNFEENGYNNNPKVPGGEGLNDLLAFSVPNQTVDFSMVPHPTGKYIYIIMHESHYILRSNYDEETKKLVTPYIVCGQSGQADYKDLVGINARINAPGQGVFVFNEEYARQKKDDCYDFYFADRENHCIRMLTPDGVVSTFAGRGSASASSYKWGKQNGEVRERARFNKPVALAYNEETKTFYVGDWGNNKIRKIAKEQAPEDLGGEESNDNQNQENQ